MKKHMLNVLVALLMGFCSSAVWADIAETPVGKISLIEIGWNGEGINILHTAQVAGCNPNPREFAISKDHPAYRELVSVALAAYAADADVQLIVEPGTCLFGNRTKVVTLRLKK